MKSARDRRWLLAAPLAFLILAAVVGLVRARLEQPFAPPAASSPTPSPLVSPHGPPPPPKIQTDLVRVAGPVPARGSGRFTYASGRGRVLGWFGPLRRFKVAVERGSNESAPAVARIVETTLGDKRSWVGNRGIRLQRVGERDRADFTIFLATRETAGRMCLEGGVDIRAGATPYTSCRATHRVILNLDRWRLSAAPYVKAKVPLSAYRVYVINHEVGHELGEGHQGCPRRGGPAPVMVQQTLSLRGCVPYAWPRRANQPLSGPRL